jgi:hypothetical protein
METNEVNAAFEILLEEIESVANALNETGADAFRSGDYDRARQAIEESTRLSEFREKLKALQKEWAGLSTQRWKTRARKAMRPGKGRLARGLRTPEEAYRKPILEALMELGGSAPVSEVLDKVELKMKDVLNAYDREPLPSDPRSVRWRNTAQWCRTTLVREGLMKRDSPYGIWEISKEGQRWLQKETPQR